MLQLETGSFCSYGVHPSPIISDMSVTSLVFTWNGEGILCLGEVVTLSLSHSIRGDGI